MASHLPYVQAYYNHLFTVTGGKLRITSAVVPYLGRQEVYQVRVEANWNGKEYAGAFRILVGDMLADSWGDPNHPLVYQIALMLRELCKVLESHGCEYALPPSLVYPKG